MQKSLELLTSYVPSIILQHFEKDPEPLTDPLVQRFPAAVFFADISGFTRLAEELAEKSASGAEDLTELLNDYFGKMIGIIGSHGGDIVKFAGDALFAIWYNDENNLEEVVTRATFCALETINSLQSYDEFAKYEVGDDVKLYIRVSIGVGDILAAAVGGVFNRWEYVIAGDPLKQVGVANDIAKTGQVVLSPEAWAVAEATISGTVIPAEQDLFLAEEVLNPLRPKPLSQYNITENAITGLRGFVSGAILNRMEVVGEDKVTWLAEHRRISVMFMQVTNLDFSEPDVVEKLQNIMHDTQVILYRHEGSVRQLIEDDKGTVFIAVFGLPPYTHRDDPERALRAAMSMYNKLQEMGFTCRFGITTGTAFCGPIGNNLRREYAMVGSVVNLAARLMGATKKLKTNILCDDATYQLAKNRIAFEQMVPISLKNIAEPVVTYAPYGDSIQIESSLRPVVGRQAERDQLSHFLQAIRNGESHIVILEGKPGIGKTRLVKDLIEQADALSIFNLMGDVNSIEHTRYHIWNEIFSKLFDTKVNARTTMRRQSVVKNVMKNKEIMQSLPLLNTILDLKLPEPPHFADYSNSMKMRAVRKLMLDILEATVNNNPAVFVLENVQWMDSDSWDIAYAVSQQIEPVLLVLVTHPLEDKLTEAQQLLVNQASAKITLGPLTKDETAQLVSFCLDVATIAPEITDIIYSLSLGNPFFSEEIAYNLRDGQDIVQEKGEYRLNKKSTNSMSATGEVHLHVPDTLQGVITSRIDRLAPEIEVTLKTASVIGPRFNERLLYHIFPLNEKDTPNKIKNRNKNHTPAEVHGYLMKLDELELIEAPKIQGDTEYRFRQALLHEVTYNLIPFTQRRELHKEVAEWYEKNYVYDLSPYFQILGHHWEQADKLDQAFKYYEKAGEQFLHSGAYQEAIDIFTLILERFNKDETVNTTYRLAHWEGVLAEAYWGLSNMAEAQKHATKSLRWLGHEIPTPENIRRAIYQETVEQAKHRLMPKRYLGTSENVSLASEASRSFRIMQEIYYFNDDGIAAIYCSLRVLNIAETIGEKHPELARAYANFYIGLSLRQQNRLARVYKRLALTTIEKMNKANISAPVLTRIGMYDLVRGQWTTARGFIEQAANLYKKLEDKRGWSDTQVLMGFLSYFQADFWEGGSIFDEQAINAQRINNINHRVLGLTGYALHLLALDNIRLAMSQLQQAKPYWGNPVVQNVTAFFSQAVFALATLRSGHLPRALDAAKEALHLLPKSYRRIDPAAFFGTVALMDAYLELSQVEKYQAEAQGHLATLAEHLARFKKHFYAAHPYINLQEGRYAIQLGNMEAAQKSLEKALRQAQASSLPWVVGYTHFILAKIDTDPMQKADNLALALELLDDVQAAYDVNQVRQFIRANDKSNG